MTASPCFAMCGRPICAAQGCLRSIMTGGSSRPLVSAPTVASDVAAPYVPESLLVDALARVYRESLGASGIVARVCDRDLDPTGRLLGLVRLRAAELRDDLPTPA